MKLSYFTISRKFQVATIALLMFICSNVFGQKNIYKAPGVIYNSSQIINATLEKSYKDPEILIPNHISITAKSYVRLKVDNETGPFVWTKSKVNVTMIPMLPNGTPDPTAANSITKLLEVEYNPLGGSADFVDLSSYELVNRYGVKVVVNSYNSTNVTTGATTTTLNTNVTLEIGFESERYYQVSQQVATITPTFLNDNLGQPVALTFNWAALAGALEYELEWTWVDNYSASAIGTALAPGQIKFSTRDFELNNTRIKTPNLQYEIPLVFSRGYLIYRLRAVGRFTTPLDFEKTYYGPWSSGTVLKNNVGDWNNSYIAIGEHDNLKNWQFQSSYAEQGKKKEVVSYFDGSLRNRQTVTKVNTDNNAVVGEVIYDAQGRAAIEVLPVPINKNYIKYFKELNKNIVSAVPYSHLDFDWQVGGGTTGGRSSCYALPEGMKDTSGSSNYYSPSNEFINNPFKNHIPDAKNYPFSQIEYTPDNTGRIARKGGVGITHQLDSGHEMQYYYSTPSQEELNRLFGYQVGFATHYKKNTVVDPNGQVSISYLDPQGRTIATALAGGEPNEISNGVQGSILDPLDDTSNNALHTNTSADLLNKITPEANDSPLDNNQLETSYNFANNLDKLVLTKQIGVDGNNIYHKFEYKVFNKDFFQPRETRRCPEKYSFVYDLNISLKDKCQNELLSPRTQDYQIGQTNITGPLEAAEIIDQSISFEKLYLNTGTYSLFKEIKVNKDALNKYADSFMNKFTNPKSECYIKPDSFAPTNTIDCNTTCAECTAIVGTQSEYVLKQLKGIYNIPATDTSTLTINTTTFALTIGTIPANSTINLGQAIPVLEASGLVVKLRADWATLKKSCDYICGVTFSSGCGVNERTLLTDVSPKGQYFTINTDLVPPNNVPDPASLYYIPNQIISGNDILNHNWKNPTTPYFNETGQPAEVQVDLDPVLNTYLPAIDAGVTPTINAAGLSFVSPEKLLNADDFVRNWKPSWASSLLKYHPEYCYLEYSRKVCENVKLSTVKTYGGLNNAVLTNTQLNVPLTSDEYDGYITSLETYQKALDAGFINDLSVSYPTSANSIGIYSNDPYFSQFFSGFENSSLFTARKDLMIAALTDHYEANGAGMTLFKVSMQIVKCNAVQPCVFANISNFSNWTTAEKDRLWNSYKSLYVSFKSKIKYVFLNTYAINNGCYNGCIGDNHNALVTDVLENYASQVAVINTNTIASATAFCNNANSVAYKLKKKRFLPIENLYDSSIDQSAAIAQLTAQGNYSFLTNTGSCPMVNDLGIFLKVFFEDINLTTTPIVLANNTPYPLGQGMTSKLFGQLTGQVIPYTDPIAPTLTTSLNGTNTVIFNVGHNLLPSSQTQLELTLPASAVLSWNDYALFGASKWKIVGLGNIYYDQAASTPANLLFAYKIVAKVSINNPTGSGTTIKEVLFSGKTVAKIGECYIQGQTPNPYGEVIIANTNICCPEKATFTSSLKDLLVHLQVIGQINSNYVITNDPVFTAGFLPTFFNVSPGQTVRTEFTSTGFSLFVGNTNVMSATNFNPNLNFAQGNLQALIIGDVYYESSFPYNGNSIANTIELRFNTPTGIVTYTGLIYKTVLDPNKNPLKDNLFVCDSPCGPVDLNGNGVGDLCDQNINNDCNKRQRFSQAMQELILHLQQIGQVNTDFYNLATDPVFTSGYLYTYLGIQPGYTVKWFSTGGYHITINNNRSILFNFGSGGQLDLANLASFIVSPNVSGNLNYGFNLTTSQFNINNQNSTVSGYLANCPGRAVGTNLFCERKVPLYFECNSPCGEWDYNNNGIGDLCDENLCGNVDTDKDGVFDLCDNCVNVYNPGQEDKDRNGIGDACENITIPSISTCNSPKEEIYENNLKDVLNYFIANAQTNPANGFKFIPSTFSSVITPVNNFIVDSNLPSLFQSLRTSLQNVDPTYTLAVSLQKFSMFSNQTSITNLSFDDGINCNYSSIAIFFPILSVSRVLSVDVVGSNELKIKYLDSNNTLLETIVPFGNSTTCRYSLDGCSGYGSEFCNFLLKNHFGGPSVARIALENSNPYIVGDYKTFFKISKNSAKESPNCIPCIPPTVAPIACDELAYKRYLEIFQFDAAGRSTKITNVRLTTIVPQDVFCASNLQHVTESYANYLAILGITTTFDPNYLTIFEFGDTKLNYGYAGINAAINAYLSYVQGYVFTVNNEDPRVFWKEYVNTVFFKTMAGCPPKAMTTLSLPLPPIKTPCAEWSNNISNAYQLDSYNAYLQQLRQKFIRDYINAAMQNLIENFDVVYADKQYQYTLYYYDQAGNLIQTVAPEGVARLSQVPAVTTPPAPAISLSAIHNAINNLRLNPPSTDVTLSGSVPVLPQHKFKTEYKYNTLNQLVWQSTPDGGITRFGYDALGRIVASQNAKQLAAAIKRFSYTVYDILGRINEAGEIQVPNTDTYSITDEGKLTKGGVVQSNFAGAATTAVKTEVTRTVYSDNPLISTGPDVFASSLFTTNTAVGFNPSHNNRNRVTGVFYHSTFTSTTAFDNAIFYNYDVHGNVKEMINYNTYLKNLPCTPTTVINATSGQKNDCDKHIKRVVYNYDLISGNVNTVTFQPNKIDQFIHKYNYDADNRIVNVTTSPDGVVWEKDANYKYYPHGPLARVELGDKKVQGLDYAYTLQGWLKAVNGENITNPANDMGKDGLLTPGTTKTKDAFGYSLSYYNKDYKAIGGDTAEDETFAPLMFSRSLNAGNIKNLYNGNIKQMTTAIRTALDVVLPVQKNNYTYDQLNRIKNMTSVAIIPTATSGSTPVPSYGSSYTYDRNGNLQTMKNTTPIITGGVTTNPEMDNFTYKYAAGNNRLNKVFDAADDLFPSEIVDIKKNISELATYDQNNPNSHNYIYDEIGQLIEDKSEKIKIFWRVDGKVKNVLKTVGTVTQNIVFEYDGLGNRIAKKVIANNTNPLNDIKSTYYSRDAQGNVLAVYDLEEHRAGKAAANFNRDFVLKEHHLFGSSRLGLESKNVLVYKMTNGVARPSSEKATETVLADDAANLALRALPPLVSFRNYSLHFDNNINSIWSMQPAGAAPLSDPELNKFTFKTKINARHEAPPFGGSYFIGKLVYQGEKTVVTNDEPVNFVGLENISSLPDNFCFSVSPALLPNTVVNSINIYKLRDFNPPVNFNQTNVDPTNRILPPKSDYCAGPVVYSISSNINSTPVINVLASSDSGYIEYTPNYATSGLSNPIGTEISTGLTIGQTTYGYKTQIVSDIPFIRRLYKTQSGQSEVLLTDHFASNKPLRIEKEINAQGVQNIKYIYFTNGVTVANTFVAPISTSDALQNASIVVTLNRARTGINNLKIRKQGGAVTTKITNELSLYLNKTANEFKPEFKLTEYREPVGGTKTVKEIIITTPNTYTTSVVENVGLDLDLNIDLANQSASFFNVNGVNIALNGLNAVSNPSAAVVPAPINTLGNATGGVQNIEFDLCYLNYSFSKVNAVNSSISHLFSFDDVTSNTITNNPPQADVAGIQMNVYRDVPKGLPAVIRLLGPCLDDLDQDGIFDIFEDRNGNGNLADDDTDGDSRPNYNDSDDDGDGILTKFEGANRFADTNPNPAGYYVNTPSINTNDPLLVPNPNPLMIVNNIPNYLDVDDDGDGYATWETFEGGPGVKNFANPGNPYTQNTDGDLPVDYLDYTSQLYQPTLAFSFNNYLNFVGDKRYELSNHLGNVLVVVSDKKIPFLSGGTALSYFNADISSYNDYYPFGSPIKSRSGNGIGYRYGFNGKEKDDELKGGVGNSYDYGARMLDPRIGRWFANDPSAHLQPSSSPYSYANNNPVILVDPDGKLPIIPLLIKAGAAGAADMMMQVAMSYYFDDDVKTIGQAFEKVDYIQVARSAAEGLIPWKVPGGKLGKAGATALGDVMSNAISAGVAGKEYSKSQAVQDFTAGFLSDLAGGEIADLVKKFGGNKVRQVFKKLGLPDPCGCFTAGTLVYTEKGYKNIEEVQVGDIVWTFNEQTGNQELKKVINTYTKVRDHIYKIHFGDNIIEATEDHPFFIGGHWLKVKNLKVGDLLTLYDGSKLPISDIEFIKGEYEVFNFEVEDDHTYYVSLGNVLVHNSGPCDWSPKKGVPSKIGDVAPHKNNLKNAVTGDKLTPDHIPSFAAVKKAVENGLGKDLTKAQSDDLRRITTSIVIPEEMHKVFSETFKGRNGTQRVLNDAMNLRAAAESNMNAIRPGLLKKGYSNDQIESMFNAVRVANEKVFKTLKL